MIRACTLNEEDELSLKTYVEEQGAIFLSTPFSREAADRLESFDVPAYKIGSGECNNYPLVEHVAKKGRPVILSTGMNTIASVRVSVEIFRDYRIPFALMHCTNMYPTPTESVRLGAIQELIDAFPDAEIGLSDHSLSNYPCIASVALGASILERHYTDSRSRTGPDINCSMDERDLVQMLEATRIVHQARGGTKMPIEGEDPTIAFAFASVVAMRDLDEGHVIQPDDLWVMRPGGGDYGPTDLNSLIGRRLSRNISYRHQVRKRDFG